MKPLPYFTFRERLEDAFEFAGAIVWCLLMLLLPIAMIIGLIIVMYN